MILKTQLSMEAHGRAASAYLAGPLTAGVAARAILACRMLPAEIRTVRVDLRSVSVLHIDALAMLEALLAEWRAERRGITRITYPKVRGRDAFVAVPSAFRDRPDAELRPERDDRVVLTPPYPVW